MEKKHINDFISEVSDSDLMKAVEDQLHWQATSKRKHSHTVKDLIVEIYYKPLIEHTGALAQFGAYDIITGEIAKRLHNKTWSLK